MRLPDQLAFALLLVTIVVLFGVSGGMLWLVGLNYDGLSGGGASKIHPSTYFACLLTGFVLITSGNPVAVAVEMIRRRPAAFLLLVTTVLFFVRLVVTRSPGMAGVLDTFLPSALLVMLLSRAGARTFGAVELAIHAIMTVNALMGLYEFVSGSLIFPYRLDGVFSIYDTRSTALQGHPLQNATITAIYVLTLLMGGGAAIRGQLRAPLIMLQCAALVTFGGRSAMVVTCVLGGIILILRAHESLRSGRIPLLAAAAVVLAVTLLPVAVAGLAGAGFFDELLSRFQSDGGSANARLLMLDLFGMLTWNDLLAGPDLQWLESVRRLYGLEWGIENPIVKTLLYQGLIVTMMQTVAVALFLAEVGGLAGRRSLVSMLGFVVLINTFESLGGKTTLLSKFVVMLICLYRPALETGLRSVASGAAGAQAFRRPSAPIVAGSSLRVDSSISPKPSKRFQKAHG